MKYWDRNILIILEYYRNEYLIGQFFILWVSKCGMPIIMANWQHLTVTSDDHGVIGTVGYNLVEHHKKSPQVCSSWVEVWP